MTAERVIGNPSRVSVLETVNDLHNAIQYIAKCLDDSPVVISRDPDNGRRLIFDFREAFGWEINEFTEYLNT